MSRHGPLSRHGSLARLIVGGGLLAVAWPTFAFTPGRAVEPPPSLYAAGPTHTGRTWEMILPSVEAVDYLCRLSMDGPPAGARRGFYYAACYHVGLDAVVLPDPKVWPSRAEWRQIREHEWAHARGWRHNANGLGTDWSRSLPPAGGPTAVASASAAF